MSEIEDRRQRAREAYFDTAHDLEDRTMGRDLQAAIETAMRVQITPEVIAAVARKIRHNQHAVMLGEARRADWVARAAFEAAGFKVEQ